MGINSCCLRLFIGVLLVINVRFAYSQGIDLVQIISNYQNRFSEVHELMKPSVNVEFKESVFLKEFMVEGFFRFEKFRVLDYRGGRSGLISYNTYNFNLLGEPLSVVDKIGIMKKANIICGDLSESEFRDGKDCLSIEGLRSENISNKESLFEYKKYGDVVYYSIRLDIGVLNDRKVVCEVLLPRKKILYNITRRDKVKCKILVLGIDGSNKSKGCFYKIIGMMLSYEIVNE